MRIVSFPCRLAFVAAMLVLGCGKSAPPDNRPAHDAANYLLTAEPPGAKGVHAVRKEAKDGDPITIVGRVGGNRKPLLEGRAAFTIVDASFKPCNAKEGETCETPWDYCCESSKDLAAGSAMVKIVDEDGQTVAEPADQLLGVKPLQTVVVQGKAKRDAAGNLTVMASKVYIKP